MGEADVRASIQGPAHQARLLLEPGLVELLLHEVEGEPGALPLLSHSLRTTWDRRRAATLSELVGNAGLRLSARNAIYRL
jgi:hypothetical protein